MKVFDMGCDAGHRFEGWFGSESDYQDQHQRGLLECPLCGSREIARRLSAPRLNLKSATGRASHGLRGDSPEDGPPCPSGDGSSRLPSPEAAATMAVMQKAWLKALRHVIENTEDVGGGFAEEARRIHYGQAPERGIRGQASAEDRASLLEEGIDVVPLPIPKGLAGPMQ